MAGTIVADTLQDGAGNSTAMDNAIYGSAKAWVNFNGTPSSPTIRASYNVSSVTKVTTGQYQVNFTNAFIDTNYSSVGTCGIYNGTDGSTQWGIKMMFNTLAAYTTTSMQFSVNNMSSGANADTSLLCASFYR